MPTQGAHFVSADMVQKKLGRTSDDFFLGSFMTDTPLGRTTTESHFRVPGRHFYQITDMKKFMETLKYPLSDFALGQMMHLMLDNLYIDEFVPTHVVGATERNMFASGEMYTEEPILDPLLMRDFRMNMPRINDLLIRNKSQCNEELWTKYYNSINGPVSGKKLRHIPYGTFKDFLKDSSDTIASDIKNL